MLLVGVPYAANERRTDANPVLQTAIRGLIVGIWAYFQLGPVFIVNTAITVRGAFHRCFLLSLPLTLGPAVGVAFTELAALTKPLEPVAKRVPKKQLKEKVTQVSAPRTHAMTSRRSGACTDFMSLSNSFKIHLKFI
jgi:hypothetical protein